MGYCLVVYIYIADTSMKLIANSSTIVICNTPLEQMSEIVILQFAVNKNTYIEGPERFIKTIDSALMRLDKRMHATQNKLKLH